MSLAPKTAAVPTWPSERTDALRYRPQLDSLRAIAAGLVMVSHYVNMSDQYARVGGIGVRLFFVISGFLITGILLKCRKEVEGGQSVRYVLRQFYTRRMLRIFPLYYLVIVAAVVFNLSNVRAALGWYASYMINFRVGLAGEWEGFSHFWTLAVEEQFYLVWPLLVLVLPRRRILPAILAAIAMGPLTRAILLVVGANDVLITVMTPSCLDALGIGALLALCGDLGRPDLERRLTRMGLGAGLALFATVTACDVFGAVPGMSLVLFDLSVALVSAWIVAQASRGVTGLVGKILEWRVLVYLGSISYGLYVYHYILGDLTGWSWRSDPANVVAMSLVVIAISAASSHFYEQPINALKIRFPYRARR